MWRGGRDWPEPGRRSCSPESQTLRILAARDSRIVSTLVVDLILEGAATAVTAACDSAALRFLFGGCAGIFTLFACAHLFGFVFRRVSTLLGRVAPDGVAARLVALCSAITLAPFCAAPVAEDELASLAEPRETFDAADLDVLAARFASFAWRQQANACLKSLAEYRQEGVRYVMQLRNLQRADAEDVVGGVMWSMCLRQFPKDGDRRRYFFKAIAFRANDPFRRRAADAVKATCPPPAPLAPEPDAALDESWVREKISELPDEVRRVIELRELQGMTLEEAGAVLGVSKSKVDRLQKAGRALLAADLGACPLKPTQPQR